MIAEQSTGFEAGTVQARPAVRTRTVYIATTLEDNPVAQHFTKLAQALVERGHRVLMLTPHRKVELENPQANPAIYTWPSDRPTRWRDATFLGKLASAYPPDSFIAHFAAVNMMCLVGWARRVPCRIAWYHTMREQLEQDHPQPRWKAAVLDFRKRLVYRTASHVVANSHASAQDIQAAFGVPASKCRVFYNSLPDPLLDPETARVCPQDRTLVCVGRLFPSKGQDVLLQALALLQRQQVAAHLDLIGIGPAQKEYESLARSLGVAEHCTFRGRLQHAEVLRCMRRATAVVSPSRSEAFGNVNMEALAVGTPVVASAVGGIREIITDGQDGFLVPPENPLCLAERLGRILSNTELRRRLGAEGRVRFLSMFEQTAVVREQVRWQESLFRN